MKNITKILFFVFALLMSCSETHKLLREALQVEYINYPETKFIVFSDPHILAGALMQESKALSDLIVHEAKMIHYSLDLMDQFINEAESIDADFVLVCGDLTCNGEKLSHYDMAEYLTGLENSGKKVYVIPGNHDIRNNYAAAYTGEKKQHAETIAPSDFKNIYKSFGYSEAVMTDPDSLSYVAEPVPGLWIIGMDSCMYRENENRPITGGYFPPGTLSWIVDVLKEAFNRGKAVIGFMHHGILEHYKGQGRYYENYLVRDYEKISRLFAVYGMRLVFTGHFHAQDIVFKSWNKSSFLYDIETGSFVSYPCPYRIININGGQQIKIESRYITRIDTFENGFEKYAYNYKADRIAGTVKPVFLKYFVSDEDAEYLSYIIAETAMAHFAGDESNGKEVVDYSRINCWARFVIKRRIKLLNALRNDPWPPDNYLEIELGHTY